MFTKKKYLFLSIDILNNKLAFMIIYVLFILLTI